MTDRRGMALLAALWFVVAIATVGLALSLEVREHCAIGLATVNRRAAEAAAAAGLAIARARLEQGHRQRSAQLGLQFQRMSGSVKDRMEQLEPLFHLRASDPWLDADALFPRTLDVGNSTVRLHAEDLQAKLNINGLGVTQLRTFLASLLQDYGTADALAQAIVDWRDRDNLRQPRGAEREEYLARRRLDLPTNQGGFRDLEELRAVEGMTPEIFARIRPYLRTYGAYDGNWPNINSAPALVLRSIPGMTDAMIARVLTMRSQGRRILELAEVGMSQLSGVVAGDVHLLEVTVTVIPPPPAPVVQEVWMISKNGSWAEVVETDGA